VAQRVFLHVGTPKTGTTYLQRVLWDNKETLTKQGLLLPLDQVRDHYYLSNIARDTRRRDEAALAQQSGVWERMRTELSEWDQDALISHELFAVCTAERAAWTTAQLAEVSSEVHVIVTARDLARQVPAEWQQTIKHGRSHTLGEFYEELRSPSPTVLFWRVQDLPAVVQRWATGVPEQRIHLVTVPPLGAPRDLLWSRFAGLIGVDPKTAELPSKPPNESLGVEEVETLRRINLHPMPKVDRSRHQVLVRQILADGILLARPHAQRFAPPESEHPWVVERGTAMVAQLRSGGFDVVGDLDELVPPPEPVRGPNPDAVSDSAVARVATETMVQLLYRTHQKETQPLVKRVADLQRRLEAKTERVERLERRVHTLERQLSTARYQGGRRAGPARMQLRRWGAGVKRRVIREPSDNGQSLDGDKESRDE
jgi:hypothetical protein